MEELLTIKEVCLLLKISKKHLYSLMRDGKVKSIDLSSSQSRGIRKTPRFRAADIKSLIDTL